MARKPRPLKPAGKEVPLSEWFNRQPGAPVTRAQLLQVLQITIERRFAIEDAWRHNRVWYRRLWRWLMAPFHGRRRTLRLEDKAELAKAALDPSKTEAAVGPGTEPAEGAP